MATSSFSKNFVIEDEKSVELLIEAMENPVEIVLPKRDLEQEAKRKAEILAKIREKLQLEN